MATKPKTLAAPKKPAGRSTTFSQEIADEICARLTKGEPLAWICSDDRMPSVRTVSDWKSAHPEFSTDIAYAREDGFDFISADILRIADTQVEAIIERSTANGIEITRQDALGHRKLQVETRLKLLAKWDPKRYGDRLAVGGAEDMPPIKTESHVTVDPSEAYKSMLGIK